MSDFAIGLPDVDVVDVIENDNSVLIKVVPKVLTDYVGIALLELQPQEAIVLGFSVMFIILASRQK